MSKYVKDYVIIITNSYYNVQLKEGLYYNSSIHNGEVGMGGFSRNTAEQILDSTINYLTNNYGISVGDYAYVNYDGFTYGELYNIRAVKYYPHTNDDGDEEVEVNFIDDEIFTRLIPIEFVETIIRRRSDIINNILE